MKTTVVIDAPKSPGFPKLMVGKNSDSIYLITGKTPHCLPGHKVRGIALHIGPVNAHVKMGDTLDALPEENLSDFYGTLTLENDK